MLFVKYCERQFNVIRGSKSIRLGTLRGYNEGSELHLRKDTAEGRAALTSEGSLSLSANTVNALTGGSIIGADLSIDGGGRLVVHCEAPNCFIFCVTHDLPPSIEHAQRIDANYDDWYSLTNPEKFFSTVTQLLRQQLQIDDLLLPEGTTIDFLRGLQIVGWHGPVQYRDRMHSFSDEGSAQKAVDLTQLRELIFCKEHRFRVLPEYRFAFLVVDRSGYLVPVAQKSKDLSLQIDLGLAEIRSTP